MKYFYSILLWMNFGLILNAQSSEKCYDLVYDLVHDSDYFQSKMKEMQKLKTNDSVRLALLIDEAPIENKELEITKATNYSIVLYESHPDHFVNIAQFFFNPKKVKLFLRNKENNRLTEIRVPNKHLKKFPEECK